MTNSPTGKCEKHIKGNKWETIKGIRQRHGSSFCGDYLMQKFENGMKRFIRG
ncbi:hypothetical protein LINPERHAP1_LOCUS34694, partial [Linum perenne]